MAIFTQFDFENTNSIPVTVILESPSGTIVVNDHVDSSASKSFTLAIASASEAVMTVTADGGDHDPDVQKLSFGGSGKPFGAFITKLQARAGIGSIHGSVSLEY